MQKYTYSQIFNFRNSVSPSSLSFKSLKCTTVKNVFVSLVLGTIRKFNIDTFKFDKQI